MPRIEDSLLDAVVYMYESEEDAKVGIRTGGSGFLATIPIPGMGHAFQRFVVTNRHVVDGGFTVARMTSRNEDVVVRKFGPAEEWAFAEGGVDLAVWPFQTQVATFDMDFASVFDHNFVKENGWPNIGVGDECVMLGRFMGLDGRERNVPTARFGNISMRPVAAQSDTSSADHFYVETRSQAGFSGSPVFVYYETTSVKIPDAVGSRPRPSLLQPKVHESISFYLLGVDSQHLPRVAKAYEREPRREISLSYDIEIGSGILEVIPAWKLRALMEREAAVIAQDLAKNPPSIGN